MLSSAAGGFRPAIVDGESAEMPLSPEPFVAAFTATSIEFFETVVIAYALGRLGHWREIGWAVFVGHALVAVAAVVLYQFHSQLPLAGLRLLAASLLFATGGYWTLKSFMRLRAHRRPQWATDPLGKIGVDAQSPASGTFSAAIFLVMLKSSLVEAAEIAVFVLPVAAADRAAWPAMLGCAAAIAVVLALALVANTRLRQIPEVKFKFGAGLVLMAIGIGWLCEYALSL
jgi:uncharacterized membrane protein